MANWSNPTLTSLYTDFLAELKARDEDLAKQFDGQTVSNLVTGAIRWSSSANRWQKWSGSAWGELTTTYALTGLSTTGNASIGGTLSVTGTTALAAATATTPATGDNSTAVATTAYVRAQGYVSGASPALTGTPTAPTAALNTNTTQIATTAFVIGQGADTTPLMAGTAAVGTSLEFARGDHVHPTDTSRAPLASPTFTGTPAAPTAAVGTNTTQLATTAFVQAEIANDAPAKDGTGATGTWTIGISGNAATATKLATPRTINGVAFDGSADISITSGALTNPLTAGSFLTSTGTYDGSVARTFAVDATSANTASKVVARDASGNFSAGTITASLTGTASGNLALTGGTLSGALQVAAGTAGVPGIGVGEATTGLFRPGAGILGFAVGGSESFRLTAAGGMALGSTGTNANVGFRHIKNITGGTTAWAQLVDGAVQTDVTTNAIGIGTSIGTAASATVTSLVHYQASTGTLGAGTTLTNQIGFSASSTLDGATNDYGFFGNIAAGTGNWNCYMGGAAPNYFAGQVQLGAGSVGTPSLTTNGDTNTGVYFPAADQIAFATGGQLAALFDASGNLRLYNPTGTFYHNFSGSPTANRTITLPDASVTLVSGTMVPTTGTGATGTWGISVTGNAATATKLATARNINGVAFDGTADITIATTAGSSVTFNNGGAGGASGSTYNGSAALTVSYNTIGAPSTTGTNASGTWGISITGSAGSATNATNVALTAGSAATNYVAFAETATGNQALKTDAGLVYSASTNTLTTSVSGNATTATTWQTARTLTIGGTGKSVNGSANVSWSLAEIGALPSAGGTLTGALLAAAGSLSAPGIASSGDTNTGLYWESADLLTVVAGGSRAAYFSSTTQYNFGNIQITTADDGLANGTTTTVASGQLLFRGKYWNGTTSVNTDWNALYVPTDTAGGGEWRLRNGSTTRLTVNNSGTVTATTFSGSGASLTSLNASNLGSGTVPDARLSGTYTGVSIDGNAGSATLVSVIQDASTTGTFYVPIINSNAAGDRQLRVNTAALNALLFDKATSTLNCSISGGTGAAVTFNNGGAGAASGTTFNGGASRTVSYNTIGAPSTTGTNASGTWSISVTGNAGTVTNGVYTTGNQIVGGDKQFTSIIYTGSASLASTTTTARWVLNTTGEAWFARSDSAANVVTVQRNNAGNTVRFIVGTTGVGQINCTTSATAYNTSSDYRLKENLTPLTGALDRLKLIPVHRFNFIVEPDRVVDGFLAHEVQEFVPEAVTGEKDAMEAIGTITDADGTVLEEDVPEPASLPEGQQWTETGEQPDYQGIDQAKLVPLLTAAVQELLARVEALESA